MPQYVLSGSWEESLSAEGLGAESGFQALGNTGQSMKLLPGFQSSCAAHGKIFSVFVCRAWENLCRKHNRRSPDPLRIVGRDRSEQVQAERWMEGIADKTRETLRVPEFEVNYSTL